MDRATFHDGLGGVGQSLSTHRLAAAVGHNNHAYLDMNVYYSDDELRKQAELISNAIVHTGQESPDMTKPMREDLLKKTCYSRPCGVPPPIRYPYKTNRAQGVEKI